MFEKEFKYYRDHQKELVAKYNGKVIVIKDDKVLGVFADELTAVLETNKTHAAGSYMVMPVSPGDEAFTATYHSRVAF